MMQSECAHHTLGNSDTHVMRSHYIRSEINSSWVLRLQQKTILLPTHTCMSCYICTWGDVTDTCILMSTGWAGLAPPLLPQPLLRPPLGVDGFLQRSQDDELHT